ncbi:MAG: sulfite exporter TauE/SafE family protein [Candidatus Caldarchaeales archaeon]
MSEVSSMWLWGTALAASAAEAHQTLTGEAAIALLALFLLSFLIGLISPMAGIGGGVLFTPIMLAFTPVNADLVRGTGIAMVAANSLTASGAFLKAGVANLRLGLLAGISAAVLAAVGAIARPPRGPLLDLLLGLLMMSVVLVYNVIRGGVEYPKPGNSDPLSDRLHLNSSYYDIAINERVTYRVVRPALGTLLFGVMGLISGAFGVGAGWGAVPIANLIMKVPIRPAITTSQLIMSISAVTATWVYVLQGAVVPLMTVPALVGGMMGVTLGSRMAVRVKARYMRYAVLTIMTFTSIRLILMGSGLWR